MLEATHLDKRQAVCPLSLAIGYVQNYRVSERPNKGCLESRPTRKTQKLEVRKVRKPDAFADDFYKVLWAPQGEEVLITRTGRIPESGTADTISGELEQLVVGEIGTYTLALKGLGQGPGTEAGGEKGAQALKFSQKAGLQARERAVQMINDGELRAPKKNWDKTFGPEQSVTFTDEDGETSVFQIGGGTRLEQLKADWPELYNQRSTKAEKVISKVTQNGDMDDDYDDDDDDDDDEERTPTMAAELHEPMQADTEDLEAIADEMTDEGAHSEEEHVA